MLETNYEKFNCSGHDLFCKFKYKILFFLKALNFYGVQEKLLTADVFNVWSINVMD